MSSSIAAAVSSKFDADCSVRIDRSPFPLAISALVDLSPPTCAPTSSTKAFRFSPAWLTQRMMRPMSSRRLKCTLSVWAPAATNCTCFAIWPSGETNCLCSITYEIRPVIVATKLANSACKLARPRRTGRPYRRQDGQRSDSYAHTDSSCCGCEFENVSPSHQPRSEQETVMEP